MEPEARTEQTDVDGTDLTSVISDVNATLDRVETTFAHLLGVLEGGDDSVAAELSVPRQPGLLADADEMRRRARRIEQRIQYVVGLVMGDTGDRPVFATRVIDRHL